LHACLTCIVIVSCAFISDAFSGNSAVCVRLFRLSCVDTCGSGGFHEQVMTAFPCTISRCGMARQPGLS